MSLPTISLYDFDGIGLIIPWPSGVLYSNQTGGYSCNQPEVEGVFVPLDNEGNELRSGLDSSLLSYFCGDKHRGHGATDGRDADDAAAINAIFARHHVGTFMQLSTERLVESHEAWLYVTVVPLSGAIAPLLEGFGDAPLLAILTWENSD